MDRRYFKKQTTEQLDILTKWCKAHDMQFSGAESNVITSAMGEFAEKLALTIPVVVGQSEQFYCVSSNALVYNKPCEKWCGDENCKTLCNKR
jgi:hypothetical protein